MLRMTIVEILTIAIALQYLICYCDRVTTLGMVLEYFLQIVKSESFNKFQQKALN